VILDDSFSALDGKTESSVIENLLGMEGVFRKRQCTVLWITNSSMSFLLSSPGPLWLMHTPAKYFPLADEIIVLGDSIIQERGTWDSLREKSAKVAKIIHPESAEGETPATGPKSSAQAQTQGQHLRRIAADMSRKTGDLSLYGKLSICIFCYAH
jgi:ATP-binding cassette, subfamily C (CFTR/MRP), member 1